MRKHLGICAAALLAACATASPAFSQVDVDLGIADVSVDIGGRDGGGLGVDVGANVLGSDGIDADVNATIGGGSIADANVGANIGGSGGLNADVDATVGGGSLATVGIGLGTGGGSGGPGGPGGPGVPGGPGGPGGANGGMLANVPNACAGQDINRWTAFIGSAQNDTSRWSRARGVEIIPLGLCSQYLQHARQAAMANNIGSIHAYAGGDPMVASALERNGRATGDVLAVNLNGGILQVYTR